MEELVVVCCMAKGCICHCCDMAKDLKINVEGVSEATPERSHIGHLYDKLNLDQTCLNSLHCGGHI